MNYTQTQPPVASQQICDRCGRPPPVCTCCELVCFERPKYHCGHLLTDADLSLQVKYQVEKNKLRNRALHGHGVVCGLKLTCDPHCNGHIVVHDGYAIDDCGNDIVVCEKQHFDVVGALRAKRLLWEERERDRCEEYDGERDCRIKQCFYVSICYEEEDCQFETPFQAGCATGPQDCVATRTKEVFRLEVTDRLPEEQSYLDWLEKRLKHCFRLFRDSPVGRLIKQEMELIESIVDCERCDGREDIRCRCDLFKVLKGFFLEQMKQCPDELDCELFWEVERLCCPELDRDEWEKEMCGRLCGLFELMHRYQYDCVLSDLVFGCCEPEKSCCVVLGAVEIVDGRLARVCNTPRRHVWSFANLLPLAIGAVLTGSLTATQANGKGEGERQRRERCCPDYGDFRCDTFLEEFKTDEAARYKAATAILAAAKAAFGSLEQGFAFTRSDAFSPAIFLNKHREDALRDAKQVLHTDATWATSDEPASLDPIQAFLSNMLLRPRDKVAFVPDAEGKVRQVLRERAAEKGETDPTGGKGSPGPSNPFDDRPAGGGGAEDLGAPSASPGVRPVRRPRQPRNS